MAKMTLKAARGNVGLSQKDAAKKLGVNNTTLWCWEQGTTFPAADKIKDICNLYGVEYDDINFLPSNPL